VTVKLEGLDCYDQISLKAMNTSFYIACLGCKIPNWKEIMQDWIYYVDREWSRFRSNNELDAINRMEIGEELSVSPPLLDCLYQAENYRLKTSNLFSPYLLPQLEYHGYNCSFPLQRVTSANGSLPSRYERVLGPFEYHFKTGTLKRINHGLVDLGGIAKGYTVQAAAKWLSFVGESISGIVDGGGDLTVWSKGEKEWTIGVAHPYKNDEEIAQFRLKNGSIATSNIVYRSWNQGGESKHHILNGRTGLPVDNNLTQATVLTKECLDAEVAAKLCFMVNNHDASALLHQISPNISYLLVMNDGKIINKIERRPKLHE
jgi:thiamine biosynthesis lipoprotein